MKKLFLFFAIVFSINYAKAQNCSGCVANALICPNLTGTQLGQVCNDTLPDTESGATYDVDITFRMNSQLAYRANDTLPGTGFTVGFLTTFFPLVSPPILVDVDTARLVDVLGLPSGLAFTCDSAANGCYYDLPSGGTACFKICGTTGCYNSDTTIRIGIVLEYNQDLSNLINAFTGGGGFPLPLPIPATQVSSDTFFYNLFVKGNGSPDLVLSSDAPNNIVVLGQSVILSATSGFASYEWNNGATSATITVSPTANTTYTCTITDADGCEQVQTISLIVDGTVNIAHEVISQFNIYPNPANNVIFVAAKESGNIIITDILGAVKYEGIFSGDSKEKIIDVYKYNKGIYFVTFRNNNYQSTQKILIH